MSEILSAEEVAEQLNLMAPWRLTTTPIAIRKIVDSHEALRAERDAAIQSREWWKNERAVAISLDLAAFLAEVSRLREALAVERSYWQTRSHLARTKTEEVLVDYHLDSIDAALAPLVSQEDPQ
jgi:hypothetical protein